MRSVLVGIAGPDRHQILVVALAGAAALAQDRGLAQRLFPAFPREGVIDLHPVLALTQAAETGADLAHLPAVQELMVHVHQVLVHEAVVAGDFTAQAARLVGRVRRGPETRERHFGRPRGVAREHEDQAGRLVAGIAAHAVRQLALAQIRHVDAGAGAVVGPAVIAAADGAAIDHARIQRHLAVGAAVFQREDATIVLSGFGGWANQHDRLAGKGHAERLAGLEVA